VPAGVDEKAWNRAKAAVRRQYPKLTEKTDRFWALVQTVYQDMKPKKTKKALEKGGEAGTVTTGPQQSLAKRYWFQGLPISIENAKGSYRAGVDPDGHEWKVRMHYDYGYVRGTEGRDGEYLDVYVGPKNDATHAYVVHQVRPDNGDYDEDKVMLGFADEQTAKQAYLKQYDSPKFFGGIRAIPMDAFKLMLRTHKGKRLTTGPAKRFLIKAEDVKTDMLAHLQWEPPGGTHPQTWRAEYGGKYIYRRAKPGMGVDVEESGKLFTTEEKRSKEQAVQGKGPQAEAQKKLTLRQQTITMTPEQHKKEAQKPGLTKQQSDFHKAEAQKKLDLKALRTKLLHDSSQMIRRTTTTGEEETVAVGPGVGA
jgi:hypothetical protein